MRNSNIKAIAPLQSWDIYAQFMEDKATQVTKAKDHEVLAQFKSKHNWNIDLNALLTQKHTAIVVTDTLEEIQWVNPGFTDMTGYSRKDAIGQHPRFLQGKDTSIVSKREVRQQLDSLEPVTKHLLNYKKNGEPYMCIIKIFPILDTENTVTHFIALEYKGKAA